MGMFDHIKSEIPMPDGYVGELQTKDLGCNMDSLLIRADGRLLIEDCKYEVVPPEERQGDRSSLRSALFSLRVIDSTWCDLDYHGDLRIYGSEKRADSETLWHEYVVRFTHGQLESIRIFEKNVIGEDLAKGKPRRRAG